MGSLVRTSDRVAMTIEITLDKLRAPDDEVTWDCAPQTLSYSCDDEDGCGEEHSRSMMSIWLSIMATETGTLLTSSAHIPMVSACDDAIAEVVTDLWSEMTFARQAQTLADLDQTT